MSVQFLFVAGWTSGAAWNKRIQASHSLSPPGRKFPRAVERSTSERALGACLSRYYHHASENTPSPCKLAARILAWKSFACFRICLSYQVGFHFWYHKYMSRRIHENKRWRESQARISFICTNEKLKERRRWKKRLSRACQSPSQVRYWIWIILDDADFCRGAGSV